MCLCEAAGANRTAGLSHGAKLRCAAGGGATGDATRRRCNRLYRYFIGRSSLRLYLCTKSKTVGKRNVTLSTEEEDGREEEGNLCGMKRS